MGFRRIIGINNYILDPWIADATCAHFIRNILHLNVTATVYTSLVVRLVERCAYR
jgi:hypothetical protein